MVEHQWGLMVGKKDLEGKQHNAYAYTKYVNEIQWGISGLNNIGLRFFTVYGLREDLIWHYLISLRTSLRNEIHAFNHGNMKERLYTLQILYKVLKLQCWRTSLAKSFNIGKGKQVDLMDFIDIIGKQVGREPKVKLAPRHPADTLETWSNTNKLQELGYKPKTNIEVGVQAFVDWYKYFYKVN